MLRNKTATYALLALYEIGRQHRGASDPMGIRAHDIANKHRLPKAYVAKILENSVELWLDDGDGPTKEDFNTEAGVAVLELETPLPQDEDSVRTSILYFERLVLNKDYWIYIDNRFEGQGEEIHPYIVLNRYLERAEPRSRFLHTEITRTGKRLLDLLAGPSDEKEAST